MAPEKFFSSLIFLIGVAGTIILQPTVSAEESKEPLAMDMEKDVAEKPIMSENTETITPTESQLEVQTGSLKLTSQENSKVSIAATIPSVPIGPSRGSTMTDVRAQLGDPKTMVPAVGEPPITRWVYNDYTVVFEHDQVLHVVVKRS